MVLVGVLRDGRPGLALVGMRRPRKGDGAQNFFRFMVVINYPNRKKAGHEKFGQFKLEGDVTVMETGRLGASLQSVSETSDDFF